MLCYDCCNGKSVLRAVISTSQISTSQHSGDSSNLAIPTITGSILTRTLLVTPFTPTSPSARPLEPGATLSPPQILGQALHLVVAAVVVVVLVPGAGCCGGGPDDGDGGGGSAASHGGRGGGGCGGRGGSGSGDGAVVVAAAGVLVVLLLLLLLLLQQLLLAAAVLLVVMDSAVYAAILFEFSAALVGIEKHNCVYRVTTAACLLA